MAKAPELKFQKHIADFLVRVHKYGVLNQSDITDAEHSIAEDALWAFLSATQADTLQKAHRRLRHRCARGGIQSLAQRTGAHAAVDAAASRLEGALVGVSAVLPQATLQRECCRAEVRAKPHHLSTALPNSLM